MEDLLKDPITYDYLEDPVITPYGHTFSRKSIEDWLQQSRTCPITRKPLCIDQLKPNNVLRDVVLSFKKQLHEEQKEQKNKVTVNTTENNALGKLEMFIANRRALVFYILVKKKKLIELDKLENLLDMHNKKKVFLAELIASKEISFRCKRENAIEYDLSNTEANKALIRIVELQGTIDTIDETIEILSQKTEQSKMNIVTILEQPLKEIEIPNYMKTSEEIMLPSNEFESFIPSMEEINVKKKIEECNLIKKQANDAMRNNKFEEAVGLYSNAIDILEPTQDGILFLNRAAALSKMEKYDESIKDCNIAAEIMPRNSKIFRRLGFNYLQKGELSNALTLGYGKAHELDPEDEAANRALKHIDNLMKNNAQEQRWNPRSNNRNSNNHGFSFHSQPQNQSGSTNQQQFRTRTTFSFNAQEPFQTRFQTNHTFGSHRVGSNFNVSFSSPSSSFSYQN
eukprot:TRINITY_DN1774_c0_g1_i1.p1 TRINITY_DN1774_c0_g1~~TRINITY_DN1774_c0_g1_i1.p1  ORF type:complete len:455 (+),score=119.29 TRINITY_DN1774_c0_g1_i1:21-1385(+)